MRVFAGRSVVQVIVAVVPVTFATATFEMTAAGAVVKLPVAVPSTPVAVFDRTRKKYVVAGCNPVLIAWPWLRISGVLSAVRLPYAVVVPYSICVSAG